VPARNNDLTGESNGDGQWRQAERRAGHRNFSRNLEDGSFPHLLNTKNPINEDIGQPDAYFYQPADMKPKAYDAFMDWYKKQKNKVSSLLV